MQVKASKNNTNGGQESSTAKGSVNQPKAQGNRWTKSSPSSRLVEDDRDRWIGLDRSRNQNVRLSKAHERCIVAGRPDWNPSTHIDRNAPARQLAGHRVDWREYLAKAGITKQNESHHDRCSRDHHPSSPCKKATKDRDGRPRKGRDARSEEEPPRAAPKKLRKEIEEFHFKKPCGENDKTSAAAAVPFYDLPAAGIRGHKEIGVAECVRWDFPQKDFSPKLPGWNKPLLPSFPGRGPTSSSSSCGAASDRSSKCRSDVSIDLNVGAEHFHLDNAKMKRPAKTTVRAN